MACQRRSLILPPTPRARPARPHPCPSSSLRAASLLLAHRVTTQHAHVCAVPLTCAELSASCAAHAGCVEAGYCNVKMFMDRLHSTR